MTRQFIGRDAKAGVEPIEVGHDLFLSLLAEGDEDRARRAAPKASGLFQVERSVAIGNQGGCSSEKK